MKDRIIKELFTCTEIGLHENTYTEDLSKHMDYAKKLVIETIQFTDLTSKMFSTLSDELFKNIETLDLNFSTDQDTHESVDLIAEKISKCENLTTLNITLWVDTFAGRLFKIMRENLQQKMFKSVVHMRVIVHEGCQGLDELEGFIGLFDHL